MTSPHTHKHTERDNIHMQQLSAVVEILQTRTSYRDCINIYEVADMARVWWMSWVEHTLPGIVYTPEVYRDCFRSSVS